MEEFAVGEVARRHPAIRCGCLRLEDCAVALEEGCARSSSAHSSGTVCADHTKDRREKYRFYTKFVLDSSAARTTIEG
jgi:hypothetical protein